jgi:threonine-phosphate decarboxylase
MKKHGGNIYSFAQRIGCLPEQVLDFSANINPEQAVDWRQLSTLNLTPYADPDYVSLKQALKNRYPIPANADIEVFNGASAAIFALLRYLQPQDLVLYTPLYGEYAQAGTQLGCKLHNINRFHALSTAVPQNSTVIFVNPSTPDGTYYDLHELFARWQAANCTIIIDESFLDFCSDESVISQLEQYEKLYLIKSLSKFYGCAGIRIGFIAASAENIAELKRYEPAWKLSSFDMLYMQNALANTDFIVKTRSQTVAMRELLHSVLEKSDLFADIYPSAANFLLTKLARIDGYELQRRLEKSRILIRVCDSFEGLTTQHVRFAVKDEAAILQLAKALSNV